MNMFEEHLNKWGDKALESLSEEQYQAMMVEAKSFKDSEFFKWFSRDLYLRAEREMFSKATCDKGWWFAKGMLLAVELMNKNLETLASSKQLIDNPEKKKMFRVKV